MKKTKAGMDRSAMTGLIYFKAIQISSIVVHVTTRMPNESKAIGSVRW